MHSNKMRTAAVAATKCHYRGWGSDQPPSPPRDRLGDLPNPTSRDADTPTLDADPLINHVTCDAGWEVISPSPTPPPDRITDRRF